MLSSLSVDDDADETRSTELGVDHHDRALRAQSVALSSSRKTPTTRGVHFSTPRAKPMPLSSSSRRSASHDSTLEGGEREVVVSSAPRPRRTDSRPIDHLNSKVEQLESYLLRTDRPFAQRHQVHAVLDDANRQIVDLAGRLQAALPTGHSQPPSASPFVPLLQPLRSPSHNQSSHGKPTRPVLPVPVRGGQPGPSSSTLASPFAPAARSLQPALGAFGSTQHVPRPSASSPNPAFTSTPTASSRRHAGQSRPSGRGGAAGPTAGSSAHSRSSTSASPQRFGQSNAPAQSLNARFFGSPERPREPVEICYPAFEADDEGMPVWREPDARRAMLERAPVDETPTWMELFGF